MRGETGEIQGEAKFDREAERKFEQEQEQELEEVQREIKKIKNPKTKAILYLGLALFYLSIPFLKRGKKAEVTRIKPDTQIELVTSTPVARQSVRPERRRMSPVVDADRKAAIKEAKVVVVGIRNKAARSNDLESVLNEAHEHIDREHKKLERQYRGLSTEASDFKLNLARKAVEAAENDLNEAKAKVEAREKDSTSLNYYEDWLAHLDEELENMEVGGFDADAAKRLEERMHYLDELGRNIDTAHSTADLQDMMNAILYDK